MYNYEKTSYETNPVESPMDAICAFAEAYDVLLSVLEKHGEKIETDELRAAMYHPVRPLGDDVPPISVYEIGIVYAPDGMEKYGINIRKLQAALKLRKNDVRALLVQEDGILVRFCEILPKLIENENELHEYVYAAALRFLNECRRLKAMWE
jgi:hypothetical protein